MNSKFLSSFKYIKSVYFLFKRLIELVFLFRRDVIVTRTACLGNDSLKLINQRFRIINHQKCRIDLFFNLLRSGHSSSNFSFQIAKFIDRLDIFQLYIHQIFSFSTIKCTPLIFIFDSFSELTDQKFALRSDSKVQFYCNYGDLNDVAKNEVVSLGLLEDSDINSFYKLFFLKLRNLYPSVPIVFIHFPSKLDDRKLFKARADQIKSSIFSISQEISNYYIIEIPEDIVDFSLNDKFPYHYNEETYSYVKKELEFIFKKYNLV